MIKEINRGIKGVLAILVFPVFLSAQQSVMHTDAQSDFTTLVKEYDQGLYGRAARSAERFLSSYRDPQYNKLMIEAEIYQLKSWLRMDQPGTIAKIMDFARDQKPLAIAQAAYMLLGEDAYDRNDYETAIKYLSMVNDQALTPEDQSRLWFKYGYSLFVRKEFEQASAFFKRSGDVRDKFYYPSNYYFGMTQYFLGTYTEAISSFERVAPSEYYKDFIPYYITQIHFNNKDYTKVIGYGNLSINNPTVQNKTEIRHLIGQAYFETGNFAAALPHLEYVEQHTEKLRAVDFYQLGMTYYHASKYNDAIRVLSEIRNEQGIQGHYANYYLGQSYLKTGDKSSARNSLRNAMILHDVPSLSAEAIFHYGRLSAEAGDDVEAIRVLQLIPANDKNYNQAQTVLAGILTNTADYALAINELEAMGTLSATLKEAYQKVTLFRAEQLIQEGKQTEAAPLLDKSLKQSINKEMEARAVLWKGELAHFDNKYEESIKLYDRFFSIQLPSGSRNLSQNTAIANYNQGYNYLKTLKYANALTHFETAVKSMASMNDSDNAFIKNQLYPDAILRTGDAAFKRNQYETAIQYYDQSIKNKYAGYDYATYQKALIRGLQKKPLEKISLLEGIVSGMKSSMWVDDALLQAGITYQDENETAKAIASYERIVNLKPVSALLHPALLKLGLLSYNNAQYDAALKYYKSVFLYNPDPVTSREAMAAIQEIYVNEIDKPEAYFDFAATIPGFTVSGSERDSILYAAAENHYALGQYDKAAESFKTYVDKNPDGVFTLKAKFLRAESLSLAKRWEDALSAYEAVIKHGQSNYLASSYYRAALIAYNQKLDMARAYQYYHDYIPMAETEELQFEALVGALRSAYKLKKSGDVYTTAIRVTEHSRATDDIKALAHYYSANMAFQNSEYDKAIASYNEVIRINGADLAAESRYMIAFIYEKRGEHQIAAKLAEESARTNVGYPVWVARSLILLSDIQFGEGDLLNAKAIIEAIIENFQGDEEIMKEATGRLALINAAEENSSRIKEKDNDNLELQDNPNKD